MGEFLQATLMFLLHQFNIGTSAKVPIRYVGSGLYSKIYSCL